MIEGKSGSEVYFPKEIKEQEDTLRRSLQVTKQSRKEISASAKDITQVILLGSGDCYFITHAAAEAFEHLAGITTRIYEAYDFYCMSPICGSKTLVLAFSSSGKSMYTVQAVKLAKSKEAITIGLTNTPNSQLATETSKPLVTDCGVSYTFPTKTTTSALAVMFALANDIGLVKKFMTAAMHKKNEEEIINILPNGFRDRNKKSQQDILLAAKALVPCRHLLYIGSGSYRSTALIGAAKIIETSRRHITACNAEEYLHLVGFAVRTEDGVVVCANNSGNDREHLVADYAAKQGARLVVTGQGLEKATWPEQALLIDTASRATSPWVDALISMLSLHLVASEISRLSEKNPDIPDSVDVKYVIDLLYTGPVAGWKTE
jgi:glucosamine 6-phosphate synthetase-like amidotransferase/phosphosugar isomerase protein